MANDASDRHGFGHDFSRWPRLLSGDFITRVCKVAYLFGYIFTCDDMYVNSECRSLSLVMLIEV